MESRIFFLWISLLVGVWQMAAAQANSAVSIPEPLKPWVGWAMHGQESKTCPFLYNTQEHRCAWPDILQLELHDRGGRFTQAWTVDRESWVPLPGDHRHWPVDATLNGRSIAVVPKAGIPVVKLGKGVHEIKARFVWGQLPEYLQVPPDTALMSLRRNAKVVEFPEVSHEGKLWLRPAGASIKVEDRYDLEVFRHIDDTIPLRVSLKMVLDVAGHAREIKFGRPFAENFTPLHLGGTLPARIEADGSLRLQVRPGRWELDIVARYLGPAQEIVFKEHDGAWVDQEIWVFQARPSLRIVDVQAPAMIDPQQTNLPASWKGLPAYRMLPGEALTLEEKRRGDPDASPDQLSLARELWLSFDGQRYTLRDQISGSKFTGWRLEMHPDILLGRVSAQGLDQLITRASNDAPMGIELREGNVELTADSTLQRSGNELSATAWLHGFERVSTNLYLPPGWRLFYAGGADAVHSSWVNRWTLLDLFVVLVIAFAVAKLWGYAAGMLAFVTLVLIYHEAGAPQWVWLGLILCHALLQALPASRLQRAARIGRNIFLVAMVLIAVPFFVDQIRQGIYPQLEHPYQTADAFDSGGGEPGSPPVTFGQESLFAPEVDEFAEVQEEGAPVAKRILRKESPALSSIRQMSNKLQQYAPGALLQTGPGVPGWRWNSVRLQWSGPVTQEQTLSLYYLPPTVNLVLAFCRVLLVVALLLLILGISYKPKSGWRFPPWRSFAGTALLVLAGTASLFAVTPAAAELPDDLMLDKLRERLLEKAACLPSCAAIESLSLTAAGSNLTLDLKVHSADNVAIPLPGNQSQWLARAVLRNGQSAEGMFRGHDGYLWLQVGPGVHAIQLRGLLPAREVVQIALPLLPYKGELKLSGWEASGVHEDGTLDNQIVLTRTTGRNNGASRLEPGNMPAFAEVQRELNFGLDWRVVTRVTRISPYEGAILLDIPLLPGESVITEGVRVADGKARINLPVNASSLSWESVLDDTPLEVSANGSFTITLQAAATDTWVERWRVDVAPLWHMEMQGIPVIHHQSAGHWQPEWWPWPGEKVTLTLSRPQAVSGQTLTVDRSRIQVQPGLRSTAVILELRVRSSQGGRHGIVLPEDSVLQEVQVNGSAQPLRLEENILSLPVAPGSQDYLVKWQMPIGVGMYFSTPAVDLNIPSVNSSIKLSLGNDRWVLLTGGPRLGPAVLIWGVLFVVILIAAGLSRIKTVPLGFAGWCILGIGLIPAGIEGAFFVVAWFLAVAARYRIDIDMTKMRFNLMQAGLILLTLVALSGLVNAISNGLLGSPDMQVAGNGSNGNNLNWYQDMMQGLLPQGWVLSVPMLFYRILMLLWALWVAAHLIRWVRWAWLGYCTHGYWRAVQLVKSKSKAPAESVDSAGG